MIKNYLTYINESKKKYISFIPNDLFNDILKNIKILNITGNEPDELEKIMRKLMVGKYCKFSTDHYGEIKVEGYVKKINYNGLLDENDKFNTTFIVKIEGGLFGRKYMLNGHYDVRVYDTKPEKIITDVDPYGEEDWDETNESVEPKINFIPFDLREEMNPDFKKDDKILTEFAYSVEFHPSKYDYCIKILNDYNYKKEIERRLIGKNINFYQFHYGKKETIKKHGIINSLHLNSKGILIFDFNDGRDSVAVDERMPITSYSPKFNPLDPYGEDDWDDDLNEELLFGHSLSKALKRDLRKMDYGDNKGETFYIDDLNKSGKKLIRALKEKLVDKRVQFYYQSDRGIDGIRSLKEIMIIEDVVDEGFDMLSFTNSIVFIGRPTIREERALDVDRNYPISILGDVVRKFTDEDPLGEEDWDD